MARRCFQEGCVFKRGRRKKVWVGRWSECVADESGSVRRVLKSEVLGPVSELSRGDAKERLRERLRRDGNGRPADVTFQVFVMEAGGISDVQELNATAIYAGVEDSFDSPIRTLQIA
jgi:hypothetical protein